jgi:type II secretory ATPase GspE/PulE/Tfp pilus assembly ATPase PilB-like protein
VNVKAGLTFASSLRSILRQDPDVIMVGKIRDKETAEISIKAAQTGHLVLSTLHTNDSVRAITRLLDIRVPAYQIAAAVTGIVAQRLIRRLCSCHRIIPASAEFISRMMLLRVRTPPESQSVPTGCDECDLTGYKGRIGIYEILVLNDPIREVVREGGRNDQIRALARRRGMRLMHEYAVDGVIEGITTLDEVQRVVPIEAGPGTSCRLYQKELSGSFVFCPHCGEKTGDEQRATEVHEEKPEGVMN